jgi:hypothetical protein
LISRGDGAQVLALEIDDDGRREMSEQTGMASSPAYVALTGGARRVLAAIMAAIGDGESAALSRADLDGSHGIDMRTALSSVRILTALGFIEVGSGKQRISVFRLASGWRGRQRFDPAAMVRLGCGSALETHPWGTC